MSAKPNSPTVLGAIYTGGKSSRFMRDKSTALYQGRTLLDHVISSLVSQVDALVLLGGDCKPPWPVLVDRLDDTGPLGGLLAALSYAGDLGYDCVATAPCDTPQLPRDYVAKMMQAARGRKNVLVAETPDGVQPTVALWPVAYAQPLLASIKHGYSLGEAIKQTGFFETVHFSAAALTNINDQAALAKLRG